MAEPTLYVFTTPEKIDTYKVGYHTGPITKLLTRYRTSHPSINLILFLRHANAKEIENSIKTVFQETRVVNDNGNLSEWYHLQLATLIEFIFSQPYAVPDKNTAYMEECVEEAEETKEVIKQPKQDVYTGEYKTDSTIKHGKGVYEYICGSRFEGEWKEDKKVEGTITYNTDFTYEMLSLSDLKEVAKSIGVTIGKKTIGKLASEIHEFLDTNTSMKVDDYKTVAKILKVTFSGKKKDVLKTDIREAIKTKQIISFAGIWENEIPKYGKIIYSDGEEYTGDCSAISAVDDGSRNNLFRMEGVITCKKKEIYNGRFVYDYEEIKKETKKTSMAVEKEVAQNLTQTIVINQQIPPQQIPPYYPPVNYGGPQYFPQQFPPHQYQFPYSQSGWNQPHNLT